jgi:flagellar protein FliS
MLSLVSLSVTIGGSSMNWLVPRPLLFPRAAPMNYRVQAYRQTQAQSWTRVDMLLALYDKALMSIDIGVEALTAGRMEEVPVARMRLQRVLLGLIDGLDLQSDETSRQIAQLLVFAMRKAADPEAQSWQDARRVLTPLREAFAGIRDVAAAAEKNGEIPPIDWHAQYGYTA